jgi:hypothetical protein
MQRPRRHVLLVEGSSDHHLVRNLWLAAGRDATAFEVDVRDGLSNLREAFRGYLLGSEVERLGVIADADENAAARWQGFYQSLVKEGYKPVPKTPVPEGLVLHRPNLSVAAVGVWLMPDNVSAGRLEDFLAHLVRDSDPLWPRAGRVVDEIPPEQVRFKPQHRSKAHAHTWLAWQREPGVRMGRAVTRQILDRRAPAAVALLSWMERLFEAPMPNAAQDHPEE